MTSLDSHASPGKDDWRSTVDEFRLTPAVVTRVVDGDTCDVLLSLNFGVGFTTRLRLCLSDGTGLDCPEVRGPTRVQGKAATAHLEALLDEHGGPGRKILVKSFKDKKGRYGRYIASLETNSHKICDLMVEDGHAVRKDY